MIPLRMNYYGLDISSIYIDPHDATGNTVYVTVEGIPNSLDAVRMVYRSTDGGAHWASIVSNLTGSPANSIVVDPQDSNTVYIATDIGVFSTRQIATCATAASSCWSAYGTGLPNAPVVQLSAAPATSSLSVLAAATYGRGVWQIPLWTAGMQLTTAMVSPDSLTFGEQTYGTTSSAQTVTLTNTGGIALTPTAIAINGDFRETDDCTNRTLNAGASCAIQVTFTPTQTGSRIGTLKISANVAGGQLSVDLDGTGTSAGTVISLAPTADRFRPGRSRQDIHGLADNGREQRQRCDARCKRQRDRSLRACQQWVRQFACAKQRLPVDCGICAQTVRSGEWNFDSQRQCWIPNRGSHRKRCCLADG